MSDRWKWRKKPVVVDAWQFNDFDQPTWLGCMYDETNDVVFSSCGEQVYISTLEGVMTAQRGDWIIKGVAGEFYSCKPEIFAKTYEPAMLQAAPAPPPLREEEMLKKVRAIELAVDRLNTRGHKQKAETQATLDTIKRHCRALLNRGR